MNTITAAVQKFVSDEDGVTAIEYGLIAALIATALLVGVEALGDGLENAFGDIAAKLNVT